MYFVAMADEKQRVVLTVDALVIDDEGRILIMERGTEPFKGRWVLPGGFVDPGETVEAACIREVREELGLDVRIVGLVGIYSTPGRDPRGSFVSIAYRVEVISGKILHTEEAPTHRWVGLHEILPMGFDHARIVADYRASAGEASCC
jgi:8-oxo-dGTP diphosphatase